MYQYIIIGFLLLIFVSCSSVGEELVEPIELEDEIVSESINQDIYWLYDWLAAWELTSKEIFKLSEANPPIMLFYDSDYVYTNSLISAPNGKVIIGPKLYGNDIVWLKQKHNDTLTIPDGKRVPVQIMTFAAPCEQKEIESFFVMAAPSFWQSAGIEEEVVGLTNFLTGIFLHEFAHTRQMNGIGAKITNYEQNNKFDFEVGDDLIQDYFSEDSLYVQLFREEVKLIYTLSKTPREQIKISDLENVLKKIKQRQEAYLNPEKEILVEMDKIFLTMEGVGQYAMVSWLIHPKGGGFSKEIAIKVARRGKNWWSQEEGLALVLLYKQLSLNPDWKTMFSDSPTDIITLIEKELEQ